MAAAKLFAERGFGGVGTNEIGEAVGYGKGALYHHINSKGDLLSDIMTAYMIDLIEAAEQIGSLELPTREKIFALSRSFMIIMFESRSEMTVCFREVHALAPDRRDAVMRLHSDYQEIWVKVLGVAAAGGELRALSKVEIKALLGMYFYSFLWVRADGAVDITTIADNFAEIVMSAARLQR